MNIKKPFKLCTQRTRRTRRDNMFKYIYLFKRRFSKYIWAGSASLNAIYFGLTRVPI